MNDFISEQHIFTVSELNRAAKLLLNEHFFSIQVEGEISNLSSPASGHSYFSLKDAQAQVRCAMFRGQKRRLNFVPENGKHVIVSGQISLYETRGDYQLIVAAMEETGDGALRRSYEALKQKLYAQGLFEAAGKKTLPKLPNTIGIITSPSGAAIKDILAVLGRRFPAIPVIVYPVAVQGETAKQEIVHALNTANKMQQCDVLILSRGGGSLEDLWPFNEEMVARAIVASDIPIISGIGHEIDFTIADFVADLRAPTPSAAAEHIVPDQQEWLRRFQQLEIRLLQLMQNQIEKHHKHLHWQTKHLQQQHPGKRLQNQAQRLDELEMRLNATVLVRLQQAKAGLETQTAKLSRHQPAAKIQHFKLQQDHLTQRLISAVKQTLLQKQQQLTECSHTLHAVSPLATLKRGYAIVNRQQDGRVVSSSTQVKIGEHIITRLAQGKITSQIEEIDNA